MIDLEFAELHAPLFLAGTNLQMKLDPRKRHGLVLQYDREHKELHVTWGGKTAVLPSSTVLSMVPGTIEAPKPAAAPVKPMTGTAQVASPQMHVFAGPGAGKTK